MEKKVMLILVILLLISFSVAGVTTAYLTAEVETKNTFTIGKVSMVLDETDVDNLGIKESDNRVTDNTYHLMPGHTYIKDPTITIKQGSSDSYVRILVTINNIVNMKTIYGEDFTLNDIFNDWSNKWNFKRSNTNADGSITYEYRYNEIVKAEDKDNILEPIFESFTIPGETTISELENLKELNIILQAQAIQSSGLEDADNAWNVFEKEYKN